jgi:hypothetical protein
MNPPVDAYASVSGISRLKKEYTKFLQEVQQMLLTAHQRTNQHSPLKSLAELVEGIVSHIRPNKITDRPTIEFNTHHGVIPFKDFIPSLRFSKILGATEAPFT